MRRVGLVAVLVLSGCASPEAAPSDVQLHDVPRSTVPLFANDTLEPNQLGGAAGAPFRLVPVPGRLDSVRIEDRIPTGVPVRLRGEVRASSGEIDAFLAAPPDAYRRYIATRVDPRTVAFDLVLERGDPSEPIQVLTWLVAPSPTPVSYAIELRAEVDPAIWLPGVPLRATRPTTAEVRAVESSDDPCTLVTWDASGRIERDPPPATIRLTEGAVLYAAEPCPPLAIRGRDGDLAVGRRALAVGEPVTVGAGEERTWERTLAAPPLLVALDFVDHEASAGYAGRFTAPNGAEYAFDGRRPAVATFDGIAATIADANITAGEYRFRFRNEAGAPITVADLVFEAVWP